MAGDDCSPVWKITLMKIQGKGDLRSPEKRFSLKNFKVPKAFCSTHLSQSPSATIWGELCSSLEPGLRVSQRCTDPILKAVFPHSAPGGASEQGLVDRCRPRVDY